MRALAITASLVALVSLGLSCLPKHRFEDYQQPGPDASTVDGPDPEALVLIPSGVSIQGDPIGPVATPVVPSFHDGQPVHKVFTSGYEIGVECVSETRYAQCVSEGACPLAEIFHQVTREQAAAFCAWQGLRLPTEAELERAMRGDTGSTDLPVPSVHGIRNCGFGEVGQWTADNYQCDAYVGRAWANPRETEGPPLARRFASALNYRAFPPIKYGFRCARTVDMSTPPPAPTQPTCTGSCEVSTLALGERFGCALRANGSVWCWGSNADGALGTNDTLDSIPASTARPVDLGTGVTATSIATGSKFACAATSSGEVRCWGDNVAGQLAGGTTMPMSRAPVTVIASGATQVAAGAEQACALRSGGGVSCWGRATAGSMVMPTGITGATAIAASGATVCAIVGATVQCWGTVYDINGTLGTTPSSAPRIYNIAATSITVGALHACAVVGSTVQCWGNRTGFGGSGTAINPEAIAGTFVAPRVFAAYNGTAVVDQGAIAFQYNTGLPTTVPVDGDSIAFANSMDGCATGPGTTVTCFGLEQGQLGRSNDCSPAIATNALTLP